MIRICHYEQYTVSIDFHMIVVTKYGFLYGTLCRGPFCGGRKRRGSDYM